jgi:hypothetical protein
MSPLAAKPFCTVPLSNFAFKFNLRPYTLREHCGDNPMITNHTRDRLMLSIDGIYAVKGWVGWCRFKPTL